MELYNFVLNDDMNYKKEFCFVNPTKQKPWSPTYFTDLVTESYQEVIGYDKHITPHTYRRSFATNHYNNGLDVKKIKYLMGHKNVKNTLKYIQLSRKDITSIETPRQIYARQKGEKKLLKAKKKNLKKFLNKSEVEE